MFTIAQHDGRMTAKSFRTTARLRASRVLAVAGWSVIVCCLAWLGWSGAETRADLRVATLRAIRVAELRGTLSYLNEWLTMSARMAAATGDQRWIDRFEEARPKLAAAVDEALASATPEVAAELATTTEESFNGLHTMQEAAFRMIKADDRPGAVALLEGTEYNYLEAVYQTGIDAFEQDLMAFTQARATSLDHRAWLEAVGLFLGVMLVCSAVLAKRGNALVSRARARTEHAARTDLLTGLPNRRKLFEALQSPAGGQAPGTRGLAFLMLDLDRFKAINDVHGYPAGDDLLKSVAARLQSTARASDVVARFDGNEFAIIAPIDAMHLRAEATVAAQLADRIIAEFATPFELPSGVLALIGVSIGVALFGADAGSPEELVHHAGAALGRAKSQGGNQTCFFEPEIDEQVRERARLEADLRQAIQTGAVVPHFQPLVELRTGHLVAFEMLARWPLPDGRLISPADFIPLAESAKLIAPLTEHLMRLACQAAASWPDDITIACNVSPLLLRDGGFTAMVRDLLAETGLPAKRLELEITESALLEDLTIAGPLVRELRALGVSIALDDFGTGFSSLRHLHNLPFNKLKIDAGFVTGMTENAESRTIVAAVIGLGRSLGMVIVAEGVETEPTAALLRQMGCDLGQGWLFGRPTAAHAAFTRGQQVVPA